MATTQNNFDLTTGFGANWYSDAVGQEFYATWNNLPQFKGDIQHMQFMRVLTAFLDADMEDIQIRRRSVWALSRPILERSDIPYNELLRYRNLYGTESICPRLADNICTLYNDAPFRTFSADEGMQKAFTEIYEQLDVNLAMQAAYKASLFTNTVALLPDWETKKILVLTPDYFRLVVDDKGIPVELWVCKGNGGWSNTEYDVYSAEEIKRVDSKGTKVIERSPNPYGRIPAVILKLNRSNDIYGSGISEAVEISVWKNLLRFFSTKIGLYQSWSVGVATNMDLNDNTYIGAGAVLKVETKPGDQPSKFEYVSPQGKFTELEDYAQKAIRAFVRNQGLPAFLVDEGAGQPPTGAALQVMREELAGKQKQHRHSLTRTEKDMASLVSRMVKVHEKRDINTRDENGKDAFSIQYAEAQTFDVGTELENDEKKKDAGLLAPSEYVLKYTNKRMSDEEAVKFMNDNKAAFKAPIEVSPNPTV